MLVSIVDQITKLVFYSFVLSPFPSRTLLFTLALFQFIFGSVFNVLDAVVALKMLATKRNLMFYDCEGRTVKFTISKNALKLNHITEYKPRDREKIVGAVAGQDIEKYKPFNVALIRKISVFDVWFVCCQFCRNVCQSWIVMQKHKHTNCHRHEPVIFIGFGCTAHLQAKTQAHKCIMSSEWAI